VGGGADGVWHCKLDDKVKSSIKLDQVQPGTNNTFIHVKKKPSTLQLECDYRLLSVPRIFCHTILLRLYYCILCRAVINVKLKKSSISTRKGQKCIN